VFILDIDEAELEHTTKVHLKKFAPNVSSAICDLRDVSDIRKKVKQAAEFFGGRIDVLINNGGTRHRYIL
jgi:NAD(P)-dependent dehydrogenase (short-subunit alcohol dehydrogenase family)